MTPRAHPSTRQDYYADATLYDILHESGTAGEVRAVLRLARAYGPKPAPRPCILLEPACGSGRSLLALAKRGCHAVGFDMSPLMVRYAQRTARADSPRTARSVTVFRARMEDFAMPPAPGAKKAGPLRAHAAFNLINTIRHLTTDTALIAHLRFMRTALAPGGIYIVGLGLCAYGLEAESEDVWTGSRTVRGRRTSVVQTVQYLPAPAAGASSTRPTLRAERAISHFTVLEAGRRGAPPTERHIDSSYSLRSYNLAQWTSLIARAGWEVVAITDQDGLAMTPSEPGYFLWVLRPAQPRVRPPRSP